MSWVIEASKGVWIRGYQVGHQYPSIATSEKEAHGFISKRAAQRKLQALRRGTSKQWKEANIYETNLPYQSKRSEMELFQEFYHDLTSNEERIESGRMLTLSEIVIYRAYVEAGKITSSKVEIVFKILESLSNKIDEMDNES